MQTLQTRVISRPVEVNLSVIRQLQHSIGKANEKAVIMSGTQRSTVINSPKVYNII